MLQYPGKLRAVKKALRRQEVIAQGSSFPYLENRILNKSYYQVCKRDKQDIRGKSKRFTCTEKRFVKTNRNPSTVTLDGKRKRLKSQKRLNDQERRVDALALRADERRDKLRKASGRSKYPLIRRYLNGETWWSKPPSSIRQSITYGREPGELKHLSSRRKRKKTRFRE